MKRFVIGFFALLLLWATPACAELPALSVTTTLSSATLSSTLDTHSPETALYLCWRSTALYTSDDIPGCGGRQSTKEATGGVIGIKDNGDFVFVIDDLTPDKKYYYAYYLKEGSTVSDMRLFPEGFIAGSGIQTAVQVEQSFDERSYRLLSPLPGLAVLYDPGLCLELIAEGKLPPTYGPCNENDPSGFGWFINYAFQFLIGICAVLLVFRIMIEGYKYMTSDILFLKVNAKTKLGESFAGLALALAAYLLLNTINPRLVANDLSIANLNVEVDLEGDTASYQTAIHYQGGTGGMTGYNFSSAHFPSGVMCPGQTGSVGDIATIARSFAGKITYAQLESPPKGPRGTPASAGNFFLDCSSFVTTVLRCAGITPAYNYAQTSVIFRGKERVTSVNVISGEGYVNGIKLKPGDLIGWTAQDGVSKNGGHVVIYIGNGLIMEAIGGKGRQPGKSVAAPHSLLEYKKYRWVYRI